MKDHEIRELVNQLRDIAIEFHGTQQLRERIAHVVRAAMLQAQSVCTCPSGDGSLRWPCPSHPGNPPRHAADRPVAWHHAAKSKKGNYGTCCFSYAPLHDFGSEYEKTESQPHYLPEKLNYDKALRFLSDAPRKLTEETPTVGNSPVIPDGWKLVPVEPNGNMLAAAQDAYGETEGDIASTLRAAIAAAPQEVKGE